MINKRNVVAFRVRIKYFVFYNKVCSQKKSLRLSMDFFSLKYLRRTQLLYSHTFHGTRKLKGTCLYGKYHDNASDNAMIIYDRHPQWQILCNFNRNTCTHKAYIAAKIKLWKTHACWIMNVTTILSVNISKRITRQNFISTAKLCSYLLQCMLPKL